MPKASIGSTSQRACINIDFKKAFDTLKWNVIDSIMDMFGIDGNFMEMVMKCIQSASFPALIEGSPSEVFHSAREVY